MLKYHLYLREECSTTGKSLLWEQPLSLSQLDEITKQNGVAVFGYASIEREAALRGNYKLVPVPITRFHVEAQPIITDVLSRCSI